MNKRLKKQKGFVAIEAVVAMSAILAVVFLGIGFISYMYPKLTLEKEVHLLAQKAKVQGGLTNIQSEPINSDLEVFYKKMQEKGYKKEDIKVIAQTYTNKLNCIGVTPINGQGSNYIKKDSKDPIEITVTLPANKKGLLGVFSFFNYNDKSSNVYIFKETVMSERW
ncbi:hypothetical protein [Bacillus thuringiensis]|uniref:type IV pilus modification PilV family protein n=1 Tax=Bacillus thuringiensis TaxID=1428 RepID=UPI0011A74260|nr:hypothetical protein [Bacillus thuringiensis]